MTTPSDLIHHLAAADSVTAGLAILAVAVTLGLLVGSIRIRGVSLGIAGVLFAGLLFGQLGFRVDPEVLEFLRSLGLILFMYAIGLQVGPGFVSSLRADGLRLNILAIAVLIVGALLSAAAGMFASNISASGIFTGVFSTPGFAAAQEVVRRGLPPQQSSLAFSRIGLAYSIAYPFGILGPVLVILAFRRLFNVKLEHEKEKLAAEDQKRRPPITMMDIEVLKPEFAGMRVKDLAMLRSTGVVLSRLLRGNVITVPTGDTEIAVGDIFHATGSKRSLDNLAVAIGRQSPVNLETMTGDIRRLDLIVTRSQVLRRPLRELNLIRRTGVTISRINRAGVDLVPTASLRLMFADRLTVVGPEAGLKIVADELGNSAETLERPQLIPIFLGIVLGVLVGSIPLMIPGLHTPLRIGLAGGPLLAAIALSQLGNIGSIVWYMPTSANRLFRDFGLAIFLAGVGLQAGDHFLQHTVNATGLILLLWGAAVTVVPVFIVGWFARSVMRINFITLSGWIAGAMNSSPALLLAGEMAQNNTPAVAYAAVAPLATLAPIICAQVLAITMH